MFGSCWWVRPNDEQMALGCRNLDAGETRRVDQRLRPEVVVIRDCDPIEPPSSPGREGESTPNRIVPCSDLGIEMEKPTMGVEIAVEHR
jgi:hypothetical protein